MELKYLPFSIKILIMRIDLLMALQDGYQSGGVAEWLRRSFFNLVRSTRGGANPIVGTIYHNPTVNSVVHPSEVGKWVLRSNSEGTSTGHIENSWSKVEVLNPARSFNFNSVWIIKLMKVDIRVIRNPAIDLYWASRRLYFFHLASEDRALEQWEVMLIKQCTGPFS